MHEWVLYFGFYPRLSLFVFIPLAQEQTALYMELVTQECGEKKTTVKEHSFTAHFISKINKKKSKKSHFILYLAPVLSTGGKPHSVEQSPRRKSTWQHEQQKLTLCYRDYRRHMHLILQLLFAALCLWNTTPKAT